MSIITAVAETTIATPAEPARPELPGKGLFNFLTVEELHHGIRAQVQVFIRRLRDEEAKRQSELDEEAERRQKAGEPKSPRMIIPARDVLLVDRLKICNNPDGVEVLIEALQQLEEPLLLVINKQRFSYEIVDLKSCGRLTLRACGKRSH